MKLYAKISSERASKGQGGNKFLDILLTFEFKNSEGKKEYATMGTVTLNDQGILSFTDWHGNIKQIATVKSIFNK